MYPIIAKGNLQATEGGSINLVNLKAGAYYTNSNSGPGTIKSLDDVCVFQDRNIALEKPNDIAFSQKYLSIRIELNGMAIVIQEANTEGAINNLFYQRFYNTLKEGDYTLIYKVRYVFNYQVEERTRDFTITYDLHIQNQKNTKDALPLWNAWTVCERLLNIVEPLRKDEQPRFKLDQNQKQWFESVETPELQITNSTLREALQVVGSYIHAEPRLIKQNNEYIITFDKYGSGDYSEFVNNYKNYGSLLNSINIENYATNLDSNIDNFVNSLDNSTNGSIIEPFLNGYKSVLAEGSYVRITDENMYIATNYPIRSIKKLICYLDKRMWDLTPYIFESAEYNQLSSYDDEYPSSKSYALYYSIGQKGVYGLNFKRNKLLQEWSEYSIVKILKAVSGNTASVSSVNLLSFQIEYTPIYPARVQQNKSIVSAGKKWTKPYNQGQNQIEVQYYGEHLKGVIARLGNVDKTITYVIPNFPTIYPKVGELFDDNYYISTVSTEIYPFYTKTTLALSQDFNRYSEYVGVNSVKRMYEISEQQAFESEISYREFCIIGDRVTKTSSTMFLNLTPIVNAFVSNLSPVRLSGVIAQGIGYNNEDLSKVVLPIIISNFGNALLISFKYEDNYSAGIYTEKFTNDNEDISGYYTQTANYTDDYGRIKYLKLDYLLNPTIDSGDGNNYLLPPYNDNDWVKKQDDLYISTVDNPILIEKGNTEIISFNYQLEFVTNRKDLIIGSGLPKNINYIKTQNQNISLRLIEHRLNKFSNQNLLNGDVITYNDDLITGVQFNPLLKYEGTKTYKAWAFVNKNGELLLGCNMEIKNGTQLFKDLYFNVVSEKDLYK